MNFRELVLNAYQGDMQYFGMLQDAIQEQPSAFYKFCIEKLTDTKCFIQLRQQCGILIKNNIQVWEKIDYKTRKEYRQTILVGIEADEGKVWICQALAAIAAYEIQNNQWNEVITYLTQLLYSNYIEKQKSALTTLWYIAEESNERLFEPKTVCSILACIFESLSLIQDYSLNEIALNALYELIPFAQFSFQDEEKKAYLMKTVQDFLTGSQVELSIAAIRVLSRIAENFPDQIDMAQTLVNIQNRLDLNNSIFLVIAIIDFWCTYIEHVLDNQLDLTNMVKYGPTLIGNYIIYLRYNVNFQSCNLVTSASYLIQLVCEIYKESYDQFGQFQYYRQGLNDSQNLIFSFIEQNQQSKQAVMLAIGASCMIFNQEIIVNWFKLATQAVQKCSSNIDERQSASYALKQLITHSSYCLANEDLNNSIFKVIWLNLHNKQVQLETIDIAQCWLLEQNLIVIEHQYLNAIVQQLLQIYEDQQEFNQQQVEICKTINLIFQRFTDLSINLGEEYFEQIYHIYNEALQYDDLSSHYDLLSSSLLSMRKGWLDRQILQNISQRLVQTYNASTITPQAIHLVSAICHQSQVQPFQYFYEFMPIISQIIKDQQDSQLINQSLDLVQDFAQLLQGDYLESLCECIGDYLAILQNSQMQISTQQRALTTISVLIVMCPKLCFDYLAPIIQVADQIFSMCSTQDNEEELQKREWRECMVEFFDSLIIGMNLIQKINLMENYILKIVESIKVFITLNNTQHFHIMNVNLTLDIAEQFIQERQQLNSMTDYLENCKMSLRNMEIAAKVDYITALLV